MHANNHPEPGRLLRQRRAVALSLALLTAMIAGCHRIPQPSLSLLDHCGESELAQDAAGGSLIYPANDWRWREGWSEPEPGRDHAPVIWAMGQTSGLDFFLTSPRPLRLALAAHPFPYPGTPEARLALTLNDTQLAPVLLQPGWQDTAAALEFPQSALRPGWNHLTFSHPWARRPAEFGQGDPRPLAVNFSKLSLELLDGEPARWVAADLPHAGAGVDCATGKCVLPAGAARRWSFLLPKSARVVINAAGNGARLRVLFEQDGAPARELRMEKLQGRRDFSVALKGLIGEPAVLTLAAEEGGVTLSEVRLAAAELPADWVSTRPISPKVAISAAKAALSRITRVSSRFPFRPAGSS